MNPSEAKRLAMLEAQVRALMLGPAKITADQLKTSNYAEDASGNPTAGAKLDAYGTALKVAAGNLQIGTRYASAAGWVYAHGRLNLLLGVGYMVSNDLNISGVARVADGGTNMPAFKLRVTFSTAIPVAAGSAVVYQIVHSGVATWSHRAVAVSLGSTNTYADVGIWLNDTGAWLDPTLANGNGLGLAIIAMGTAP